MFFFYKMTKSFRVAIFIFISYFLISSKMFVQTVLKKIPETTEYEQVSDKGIFIQAFIMAVIFLIINWAVNVNLL